MSKQSNKALIVIDLQNDYFPGGQFPLWNAHVVLSSIEAAIHTALSKKADRYKVSVLADCTTTVDEMIHNIALHAMSTRVPFMAKETLV